MTQTLMKQFISMHQSVIKKIENFDIIDWSVKMILEDCIYYVCKDNPIAVQINSSIKKRRY